MNKAKREYDFQWWGWSNFGFGCRRGRFAGYLQLGPVALLWFG